MNEKKWGTRTADPPFSSEKDYSEMNSTELIRL